MSKKLEELLKKQEQLKAQIQDQKARARKRERALDTRRKILIGAAILKAVKMDQIKQEQLDALLAEHLTADRDRKLLGLPSRG